MEPWAEAVGRADLVRDDRSLQDLERHACLFLGNGEAGACFDFLGGMANDIGPDPPGMIGATYLVVPWHICGGPFGMEYVVPVGRLVHGFGALTPARRSAGRLRAYRQRLLITEGRLVTSFAWEEPGGSRTIEIEQFFPLHDPCPPVRGLFLQRVRLLRGAPFRWTIRFLPVRETGIHYGGSFRAASVVASSVECGALWRIDTDRVATGVALVSGRGAAAHVDDGIEVEVRPGEDVCLALSVVTDTGGGDPVAAAHAASSRLARASWDELCADHVAAWADSWRSGWVDPGPDRFEPAVHALRTVYAAMSSVSPLPGTPPPLVCGLARVAWPSYFPQDFSFLHEVLVRFGRSQRARASADWWPLHLGHAREYAGSLLGLKTAYYPWTAPILRWDGVHRDGPPNRCYYEHHNQAYVARMLHTVASCLDPAFAADGAYAVVRDLAETYRAMLRRDAADGLWSAVFRPTFGQDEAAPSDRANYFDLLTSMEYVLNLACDWSRRLDVDRAMRRRWETILGAGLAFARCARGKVYGAYAGDSRPVRSQKHPVQLNPIALLPMAGRAEDPRVIESWRRRLDLLRGYDEGRATAWTVGELALASARMRDARALHADLGLAAACSLYDPELVQWREGTGSEKSHFLTTPALVTTAVCETCAQSWRGYVDLYPMDPSGRQWPRLAFGGLRLDHTWSAAVQDLAAGRAVVALRNSRRTPLRVRIPSGDATASPAPDGTALVGGDRVWHWNSADDVTVRLKA